MTEGFYVTIINGPRHRYARGPFASHEAALEAVEPTRALASQLDPWSDFYAWGTTKLTAEALPPAPMNRLFEENAK